MSDPILLRQTNGAVARLTLNDPARANVLSGAMMAQLSGALTDLAADPAVHVIVLAANGRIFCAGHDLAELRDAGAAGHGLTVTPSGPSLGNADAPVSSWRPVAMALSRWVATAAICSCTRPLVSAGSIPPSASHSWKMLQALAARSAVNRST